MDAFFASVEQADNPELRGQPVIIGQSLRGVASAASYEARKYGVHSAMPIVQAKKLCPHGIFLPGRMSRYQDVSRRVMSIMRRLCPTVEQASVDEAYADISGTERLYGTQRALAERLKRMIEDDTGLTCSIGIAPCKFLAKIASDWDKPNGLTIIEPDATAEFLRALPVAKIPGVGRRFQEELLHMGVTMVQDVLRHPKAFWDDRFGKRGRLLHDRALGIDLSEVCPDNEVKSCSAENTFDTDIQDCRGLERWLLAQAERVGRQLRRLGKRGVCVTLKLKFNDFKLITRNATLDRPTDSTAEIYETARTLLTQQKLYKPVRLIGLGVSQFRAVRGQLPLFPEPVRERRERLDRTMDLIRDKFGTNSISRAEARAARVTTAEDLLSQKNRINSAE